MTTDLILAFAKVRLVYISNISIISIFQYQKKYFDIKTLAFETILV